MHKGYLLVVDDNEMNCDLLSRRLTRKNYKVKVALNGFQALELIDRERFDMVLLDIMMPGISGIDVLRQIRQRHAITELPVLMTTAKRDSETVVEALRLGANDYLTKPFDLHVVLARIDTHLSIKQSANRRGGSGLFSVGSLADPASLRAEIYCPSCESALFSEQNACGTCKNQPPADGWPLIADSELEFLGQVVGDHYFLEQFLGQGTMGEVYRCRDLELSRAFALKVIDISKDASGQTADELRARIKREVEAMVRLQSPYVVKIYEVLQISPGVYGIVMDFLRGKTLGEYLDGGIRFDPHTALKIVRQVAQGLYEAHRNQLIHRDVKPENIMLERLPAGDYFAQVLDFGIVFLLDKGDRADRYFGTPLYTAPEQIQKAAVVDHRVDIYALGAVLFHMLAGDPPFHADTVVEILAQHLHNPIPSLALALGGGGCTQALDGLMAMLLAKDRDERFQDLRHVISVIDELMPLTAHGPTPIELAGVVSSAAEIPVAAEDTIDMSEAAAIATAQQSTPAAHTFPKRGIAIRHSAFPVHTTHLVGDERALIVERLEGAEQVTMLDLATSAAAPWCSLDEGGAASSCASPCGRFVALFNAANSELSVRGIRSKQVLSRWRIQDRQINALALSFDAKLAACGSENGMIYLVDNWGAGMPRLISKGYGPISSLAFTASECEVAIGERCGTVTLLPINHEGRSARISELGAAPRATVFREDGSVGVVFTERDWIYAFSAGDGPREIGRSQIPGLCAVSFNAASELIGLLSSDRKLWQLVDLTRLLDAPPATEPALPPGVPHV